MDRLMAAGEESFAEATSYFPPVADSHGGLDRYLETLRQASEAADIPIIGSLNGISAEGWVGYATGVESAGASAIELNVYYIPADLADIRPPLDYAPKASPEEKGMLNEEFGIDRRKSGAEADKPEAKTAADPA